MLRYVINRVLLIIPVIFGVLVIVFLLRVITPGDPVDQLLPAEATQEQRDAKREELGLNDPLLVQFGRYIFNFVIKGDIGVSYKTNQPVIKEIMARFPITIALSLGSVLLGVVLGVPLGVVSSVRQYSWVDSSILVVSMVSVSMPSFWLALICISQLSVKLGWLPASGIQNPLGWIMPIAVIGFNTMSSITRITRSSMLEVIRQDYIRTAHSKGQSEGIVVVNHALRNALIPIIANVGNQIGIQLGGALTIEAVFGMPGIGKYVVDAISSRNYPAVQGGVIILALTFTTLNLLIDLSYAAVDPRLKSSFIRPARVRKAPKPAASGGALDG